MAVVVKTGLRVSLRQDGQVNTDNGMMTLEIISELSYNEGEDNRITYIV